MTNFWDDRYTTSEFYYGKDPNDFLREHLGVIPPGGRVLCLAEGEGRNAVYLAKAGFQVTAIDGSRVGLDKLEQFAAESGVSVKTIHADLNQFTMNAGEWEGIVSIWCHLPRDLRKRIHRESVSALSPGGVFLLEAYRPKQLEYKTGGPSSVDLLMELSDLKNELAGLNITLARETEREIKEGQGHSGMSAVVQFIGTKL